MSGGAYKTVRVRDRWPGTPVLAPFRGGRPLHWAPWSKVLEAQDRLLGSALRVVASMGMYAGENEGHVPVTATTSSMISILDHDVHTAKCRITPGNFLDVMILALPSGVVKNPVGPIAEGAQGWVVIEATFDNGSSTTSRTTEIHLQPSTQQDGGLLADLAGSLFRAQGYGLMPTGAEATPATIEDYSEWIDCALEFHFGGGARPIDIVVFERGWYHSQDASPSELQSAHAYVVGGMTPQLPHTPGPQEARADGGTAEGRFGTHQLLDVVERQAERMGPRIVDWSSWSPSAFSISSTQQVPHEFTGSTSFQDLFDSSITSWHADNPGWLVEGSGAQLWRYCDGSQILGSGRAVVPVRVTVRAAMDHASNTGTLRFQSSETEWIDITISGTSASEYTRVGFLECQVVGDQADRGNLEVFAKLDDSSGDTIEVYDIGIDFGDWA